MTIQDSKELNGVDSWKYPLSQFIDIAIRYDIEGVYNSVRKNHEYSILLEEYVFSGRELFKLFKNDLRERLSQSVNPDFILMDIQADFHPMIELYKGWYDENKRSTEIFEPYNPYRLMFEIVLSTEREIAKYKPKRKQKTKKPQTFEGLFRDKGNAQMVKDIFENKGYTLKGEWHGLTGEASELRDAFYVLKPLLKPGKDSPRAKVFYSEFGLTVATKKEGGYISERMLTIIPMNHKCKEFEDIFSDLLK